MAIDPNLRASCVAIETNYYQTKTAGNFLPQRIAVFGQGANSVTYSLDKKQVLSAYEAGSIYGFGSPIHLAVSQLLPTNGNGVGSIPVTVYPLDNPITSIARKDTVEPSGVVSAVGSYRININNTKSSIINIDIGDTIEIIVDKMVTAINSNLNMPVVASDSTTEVLLTAKWVGESTNDIYIEVENVAGITTGITFTIANLNAGSGDPLIDNALAQIGDIWETLILNCLNKTNTAAIDTYYQFGLGRWNPIVKKPLIVFTGDNSTTVYDAVTLPNLRKSDYINTQLVSPSSKDLPFIIAARELAKIAIIAENNPATGYNGQIAEGLMPAADGDMWNYTERDYAVKNGSSTVTKENNVIVLGDIITFYHPEGDPLPSYSRVVNIVKLANILYNLDLIFGSQEWRDAPLVADGYATVNPNVKTPAMARAAVAGMLDYLGSWAIISDPDDAKSKTICVIDGQNPNRLNITLFVKLSGNTNIKAITLNYGFEFGGNE